jgi:plastocyanin
MGSLAKILAVSAALSLLAVACGGGKETGFGDQRTSPAATATTPSPEAGSAPVVAVGDIFFRPKEVTVAVGTNLVWKHEGQQPHSVTADDGTFDSHPKCPSGECMQNGDRFEFTFTKAGRYPYYCRVHGGKGGIGQSGIVIVQ